MIIAGGRNFNDYNLVKSTMDNLLQHKQDCEIIIVNGGANGADRLGLLYGNEKGYTVKDFPADWELHGKRAGYLRNQEMSNYADAAVVFWDGVSRGSKHMIDISTKDGKEVRVIRY